jgi:hypothetical protein
MSVPTLTQKNDQPSSGTNSAHIRSVNDIYTLSYILWTGTIFLCAALPFFLERFLNLYLFLIPAVGLPAIGWLLAWLYWVGTNVLKKRWRRLMSVVAAPIVVSLIVYGWRLYGPSVEDIQLLIEKPRYLKEIADLPANDVGKHLKIWEWGSIGGVGVTNIFYILVYDDSDQIGLPYHRTSADWKERADKAAKGNDFWSVIDAEKNGADFSRGSVKKLDEHFYLITEVF